MAISIEGEMARESHTIEAMVRGYHVYKEMWYAAIGEELSCVRESGERWPCPLPIAHTQSRELAYRFLFRGFNFRGLPINRENRENWTPRKFPAIRY